MARWFVYLEVVASSVLGMQNRVAVRLGARVGRSGEPIPLLDQDRARWDHVLIRRGLAALERAEGLGGESGNQEARDRGPSRPGLASGSRSRRVLYRVPGWEA